MNSTAIVRMMLTGATGALLTTASLTAKAALPGDGYEVWFQNLAGYNTLNLQVGPSQATCFLSGIGGNLSLGSLATGQWAGAMLDTSSGLYSLETSSGTSTTEFAEAHVTCVWTTKNQLVVPLVGGPTNPSTTLEPAATGRQCFVQGIQSYGSDLGNSAAQVNVFLDSTTNNWTLQAKNLSGNTTVYAVCVDGLDKATSFEENHWTGTFTVSTLQQTDSAPVACGLRGFAGAFTGSGSDGVNLNWPKSNPGDWNLTATNGKFGWLTCLQ